MDKKLILKKIIMKDENDYKSSYFKNFSIPLNLLKSKSPPPTVKGIKKTKENY